MRGSLVVEPWASSQMKLNALLKTNCIKSLQHGSLHKINISHKQCTATTSVARNFDWESPE